VTSLPKQTSRRDLIAGFRKLGFEGPFPGLGKHPEFMSKDKRKVTLPNSHRGDIRQVLLKNLLQQAGVTLEQWTTARGR